MRTQRGSGGVMQRRIPVGGWVFLALAAIAATVIVVVGALRSRGTSGFNDWVGWATVAALPVAVLGVVLLLWEKIAESSAVPDTGPADIEAELAALVMAQAQVARSRLIGAGEAGDRAANVRFVRGIGRFREVGGAREGDLATVLQYYQALSPARLVVLGNPGAGKTVLALELQIRLLEYRRHDMGSMIPVYISAAAYDTRISWPEWLAEHLALRFSIRVQVVAKLIRDNRILPIVDGIDEMDRVGEQERARALVEALNSSMQGLERAPLVVTCRSAEYQDLVREIDRATHIQMIPLTGDEAANYLREQFHNQTEQKRWSLVLTDMHAHPSGPLAVQLTTPWRLTLALSAFREVGDPADLLPRILSSVGTSADEYERHVDSLLLGGYVPAAVHLHDSERRYTVPQVQRWLTSMADGLAWQAHHHRSASDIRLDQWWRPSSQQLSRFIHCVLAAIPSLGWIIAGALTDNSILVGGSVLLLFASIAAVETVPRVRLRVRRITKLVADGRYLTTAAFVFTVGIAAGVAVRYPTYQVWCLCCVWIGLTTALLVKNGDKALHAAGPLDVIRADGRASVAFATVVGLYGAAFYVLVYAQAVPVGSAEAAGFCFSVVLTLSLAGGPTVGKHGLSITASVWTRYHIAVMIAAFRGESPLRFSEFLDWAQQAGLLRVSGVAYQFRHRQLQDWLTSDDERFPNVVDSQP
jgi:hypothetical protein